MTQLADGSLRFEDLTVTQLALRSGLRENRRHGPRLLLQYWLLLRGKHLFSARRPWDLLLHHNGVLLLLSAHNTLILSGNRVARRRHQRRRHCLERLGLLPLVRHLYKQMTKQLHQMSFECDRLS